MDYFFTEEYGYDYKVIDNDGDILTESELRIKPDTELFNIVFDTTEINDFLDNFTTNSQKNVENFQKMKVTAFIKKIKEVDTNINFTEEEK